MATSNRAFGRRNAAERARLRGVIARLSDADLRRPLGDGWTVAVALAHLAHWDRGVLAALAGWERGAPPTFDSDADTINAEELARWQATPPRAAAEEALVAAEAVDRKVESLPDGVVEAILAANRPRLLDRSLHRHAHLDQIEDALGQG